jgi:hypothetical protein
VIWLRLISIRRARSAREIDCVALTILNIARVVSPEEPENNRAAFNGPGEEAACVAPFDPTGLAVLLLEAFPSGLELGAFLFRASRRPVAFGTKLS